MAERIKEAREFGDISENSEYDDAKNEQAMLEARIATLEDKLRSASVIDSSELDNDVVRVGSLVNVKDEASGKSLKYTIVGSTESNPAENKLSNESPVARSWGAAHDEVCVAAAQRQGPQATITKSKSLAVSEEKKKPAPLRCSPPGGASSRRCASGRFEPFPMHTPGAGSR